MPIRIPVLTLLRLQILCAASDHKSKAAQGVGVEVNKQKIATAYASNGKSLACERIAYNADEPPFKIVLPKLPPHIFLGDVVVSKDMAFVEQNGIPVHFLSPIKDDFPDWRKYFNRPEVKKPTGTISFDAKEMTKLIAAAPTGAIIFCEYIGATVDSPILIADAENDAWIGLFLPVTSGGKHYPHAIVPEWAK